MDDVLRQFGLTDNEIMIYRSLLELGSAPAGEVTVRTGIHRRNVYDSIERLIKKGLVGYVMQGNMKQFTATDPKQLLTLLEREREELRKREAALKKALPQMALMQGMAGKSQRVTIYEGRKGIIYILEDVLKTGKPNLVFSTPQLAPISTYLPNFHEKRVKLKIHDKILSNTRDLKRVSRLAKLPYTEVRLIDREFDSPFVINVYGNKIGMLILSGSPIGILIEDKEVSDAFKKYFNLLWELGEKV